MKNIKMLTLSLICVLTLAAAFSLASAMPAPTPSPAQTATLIATNSESSNTLVQNYSPGQTIYLKYTIPAGTTATLVVMNETALYATPQGPATPVENDTFHIFGTDFQTVTLSPGIYEAEINGASAGIVVAPIFVLPESVIGSLAALGAGLAAFGIYQIKIRRSQH